MTDFPPPKIFPGADMLEENFLITDEEHNIRSISLGLNQELGLHPTFFEDSNGSFLR